MTWERRVKEDWTMQEIELVEVRALTKIVELTERIGSGPETTWERRVKRHWMQQEIELIEVKALTKIVDLTERIGSGIGRAETSEVVSEKWEVSKCHL
jgi:phenylalanyl-tRNA synthetase beta subunit